MQPLHLHGVHSDVNKISGWFREALKKTNESFLLESGRLAAFDHTRFYTAVTCSGCEDGEYHVFCGRQLVPGGDAPVYGALEVPGGWYADFVYTP